MERFRAAPAAGAFTLLEILVALAIVCAAVTPVFLAFFTSRRTVAAASGVSRAVSFASSYMAALREAPPGALREFGPVEDVAAPGALSPAKLRLDLVHPGFSRRVTLKKVDLPDQPAGRLYHAVVAVEWRNTAGEASSYVLEGLIDENR